MRKILSFEVLHVEIAQKLQNLEFFFKNHQKNQRKLKIHQKMANYEENFQIL